MFEIKHSFPADVAGKETWSELMTSFELKKSTTSLMLEHIWLAAAERRARTELKYQDKCCWCWTQRFCSRCLVVPQPAGSWCRRSGLQWAARRSRRSPAPQHEARRKVGQVQTIPESRSTSPAEAGAGTLHLTSEPALIIKDMQDSLCVTYLQLFSVFKD